MGVPKFYRWLSERYPCINENVNQYNIPEFDNFYVDMNGVFHICSHPSDDVHFRLSESQIFENIAIYIEFLFNLVQPRKVFFLSVDGVAPRSKMNQQRSRRYKTAKEAMDKEEKAKRMGEDLPKDPRFDSNCITPGTEFMDKLHKYLVHFLANKTQNNQSWREVEIIYSGYDVPGEGEHKIMDYIRYSKTTNAFSKTVRHCLYGLDADLINLGLSCHEPYFSLLREEVNFSKNQKRHCDPFKTNFQLLHLSILRDYLNKEFETLKPSLPFEYDLEKIIDDWILMNFFIGNDFLPHIPKFHVDKGSIQILYDSYKAVLPTLDGYMNQAGTIHLPRYRKFLEKLSEKDMELFNDMNADLKYFNQDFNDITFGDDIDLDSKPFDFENGAELSDSESSDEKGDDDDDELEDGIEEEFTMHKNNYYRSKMRFNDLEQDVPRIVNEYLKGVQWVLHYYFNGCVSWNWYYPYYYGPYISDLAKFDAESFDFQKSTPFKPLLQLLAVIPQASKEILPKAFQKLTHLADSPLIEYFPKDVTIDLNEKIHDYEAIILIPFIDETLLLDVFEQHKNELTVDEIHRNQFGKHYSMMYSDTTIQNSDIEWNNAYPNVKITLYDPEHYMLLPEQIYKGVRKDIILSDIIGFPTLNGVKYEIKIKIAHLKVFRFASQNPSMLLMIEEAKYEQKPLLDLAKKILNKRVYINWPLLSEAKLLELYDCKHKYSLDVGNQILVQEITKLELGYAKQQANGYCSNLKNKKGVILDRVEIMAKVVPLQSQKYIIADRRVILHKEWSKTPQFVPLEFVIHEKQSNEKIPVHKSMYSIFTPGKSFFLINHPHYGYKAEVLEYIKSDKMVRARICVTSEPDFDDIKNNYGYIMEENYQREGAFIQNVKRSLNLPEWGVRRLLGSALISYKDKGDKGRERKMNLGLKLKYKSNFEKNIKPYCVPGYSLADNFELYYNHKVIDVLQNYKQKFPFVFEMLSEKTSQNKPIFELDDLFKNLNEKDKSEKITKLGEIKDWIDSLELSKTGHVKSDSNYLDNCIVKAIEETIDSHAVLMIEKNIIEECLPPNNFYISEFVLKGSSLPDPQAKFFLFDRVVNIKKCIAVPYGGKGTIIGIYRQDDELKNHRDESFDFNSQTSMNNETDDDTINSVIEVLFDEPFDGGIKTRGTKANTFKMQASWLINVSYGLATSKRTIFRNVYNPINSSNHRSTQPKNSNKQNGGGKQIYLNQHLSTNNKCRFNNALNKSQVPSNHSESSPFKTINSSNTNVYPNSMVINGFSNVTPPVSNVSVQPVSLSQPIQSASDILQNMFKNTSITIRTNSQAYQTTTSEQPILPPPPPATFMANPSGSQGINVAPPRGWIESAKKKKSRTFYPTKYK